MGMKRQEHTVNNKRHVSPQVLSTDCCGELTNDAVTLPFFLFIKSTQLACLVQQERTCFSVAPRGGEHPKIIQEHHFHRKN